MWKIVSLNWLVITNNKTDYKSTFNPRCFLLLLRKDGDLIWESLAAYSGPGTNPRIVPQEVFTAFSWEVAAPEKESMSVHQCK